MLHEVDGFVVVRSRRPLPTADDPVLKHEGAGIMMNPVVAAAWGDCEECWKANSSRLCILKRKSSRRGKWDVYLSVVSVYAPTYHSLQEQNDMLYDDLCCFINSIIMITF